MIQEILQLIFLVDISVSFIVKHGRLTRCKQALFIGLSFYVPAHTIFLPLTKRTIRRKYLTTVLFYFKK